MGREWSTIKGTSYRCFGPNTNLAPSSTYAHNLISNQNRQIQTCFFTPYVKVKQTYSEDCTAALAAQRPTIN